VLQTDGGFALGKVKTPHKKFQLKPIRREPHTPKPDMLEPTRSDRRGYWPGANYSALERAWLKAVESLQRRERRKFLSHVDYLRLAITLGWLAPPDLTHSPPDEDGQ